MPTIYALRCEDGFYYVGQAKQNGQYILDVERHFQGEMIEWTKIHKPQRVDLLRYFCDENEVDEYTIMYMTRYGLDKVRGGSYSACTLSQAQLNEIQMFQLSSFAICDKCGMNGHNRTKCPFTTYQTPVPQRFEMEMESPFMTVQNEERRKSVLVWSYICETIGNGCRWMLDVIMGMFIRHPMHPGVLQPLV